VVEEITIGKRRTAQIEPHGDITVHDSR